MMTLLRLKKKNTFPYLNRWLLIELLRIHSNSWDYLTLLTFTKKGIVRYRTILSFYCVYLKKTYLQIIYSIYM